MKVQYLERDPKKPRLKSYRPRDAQKSRCYHWEDATVYFPSHYHDDCPWKATARSTGEVKQVFNQLKHVFGLPETEIVFDNGRLNHSYASYFLEKITMCKHHHHSVGIMCHEFAHIVANYINTKPEVKSERFQSHGPEWLTIYMILLNHVLRIPTTLLFQTAGEYKLKFYQEIVKKYEYRQNV